MGKAEDGAGQGEAVAQGQEPQSLPSPLPNLLQGALPPLGLFPTVRPPLCSWEVTTEDRKEGERQIETGDVGEKSERKKNVKHRSELDRDFRSWLRGQGTLEVKGNAGEGWKPTLSQSCS